MNEAEMEYLALLEAEDYLKSEQSLAHFIKASWEVLEPETPYKHNWHIDLIAEYLTAVYSGQVRRLIIEEPPRCMKSIQCSICFPAWVWLKRPTSRWIFSSYSGSLSSDLSVDRRRLIQSDWYQYAWRDRFQMISDQNVKMSYENNRRGKMVATSVGGTITGKGADFIVVDDIMNPKEAASDVKRQAANDHFDKTLFSRLNDPEKGAFIIIMQRLHEKDLAGHLQSEGGWEVVSLPAEATKKTIISFPVSKKEVVRDKGHLLWPDRLGEDVLKERKKRLGSAQYQAQYQQDPRPQEGGFFKRPWWRRYKERPMDIKRIVQFWDCAEEPGLTNDYSVCATWAETRAGFYLLDLWQKKVTFPELENACKDQYARFKPQAVVIEKKSAGTQLIQNLRASSTLPIIPVVPTKSKVVRAAGAQPTVEAGNCYLPEGAPWVESFIENHEKFPNAEHDDDVDTTSMMVNYFGQPAPEPRIR